MMHDGDFVCFPENRLRGDPDNYLVRVIRYPAVVGKRQKRSLEICLANILVVVFVVLLEFIVQTKTSSSDRLVSTCVERVYMSAHTYVHFYIRK